MKISIKWVNKANQWCATFFVNGVQKQKWFATRKEAKKFRNENR